jgi:Flp pilus assembly pilin Flp
MLIIHGPISTRQEKKRPPRSHPGASPGGTFSCYSRDRSWRLMRLIRHVQRHWRQDSENGAAAVEFAIIVPLLVLLILGGMDLGHEYYMEHLITNASREGARYAAKYTGGASLPTSSQISTYVITNLNYGSFDLNSLAVTGAYAGVSPSEVVTVTVTADKYWWILGSLLKLSNPTILTATTAMIVE